MITTRQSCGPWPALADQATELAGDVVVVALRLDALGDRQLPAELRVSGVAATRARSRSTLRRAAAGSGMRVPPNTTMVWRDPVLLEQQLRLEVIELQADARGSRRG